MFGSTAKDLSRHPRTAGFSFVSGSRAGRTIAKGGDGPGRPPQRANPRLSGRQIDAGGHPAPLDGSAHGERDSWQGLRHDSTEVPRPQKDQDVHLGRGRRDAQERPQGRKRLQRSSPLNFQVFASQHPNCHRQRHPTAVDPGNEQEIHEQSHKDLSQT